MVRLAVLLVGGGQLGRHWHVLAGLGLVWMALGLVIMADAADGVSYLAGRAFAALLVAEGAIALVVAVSIGRSLVRFQIVKALGMIVLGLLILDWPWDNNIANSLLFGLAFLIDGLVRMATAAVVRFKRWPVIVLAGVVELGLAGLAVTDWPVPYQQTVPFCVGLALALSGWSALRIALVLRRTLGSGCSAAPAYAAPRWLGIPDDGPAPGPVGAPAGPLVVQVWTPVGSAEGARGAPLVARYIAAVDRRGRISTGHAALMAGDELYISHYPGREVDVTATAFANGLRASTGNDVPGRFLPSYRDEAKGWREADQRVVFHRYDAGRLAAHWATYCRDATYNLADRNCSVAVALALDAALDGVLGHHRPLQRLLQLLVDPNLWLAAMVRAKAEAMTWTPGLVLDYARALKAVVDRAEVSWTRRLRDALRRWRVSRGRAAREAARAV